MNTYIESSDSEPEEVVKKEEVVIRSSSESSYDDEEVPVQKIEKLEEVVETVQAQATMAQQPKPRRKRFIPKYEVEGVYRVILGEDTQIQIEMVIGVDINAQYPWKLVRKSTMLEIIEVGGELSEFFPIKEHIEAYPEEMILMGYMVDESKDVDEFYVCCTIEARDHCKQQSDRFIKRQEKKLEKAVQKKPRPWTSLGSEKDLIELRPVNTRPLMEVEIRAKFPTEYQPGKFKVRDTNSVRDGYIELTPYRQKFNNVYSRRIDTAVQVAPAKRDNSGQTELRYPKNMWTQSIADSLGQTDDAEGGGDAKSKGKEGNDLDDDEDESSEDEGAKDAADDVGLATYKAAMMRMRRPSYIKMIQGFISTKKDEVNSIIELNTVMDMYRNDYPQLTTTQTVGIYDTMTFEEYVCFTDVRAKDKYVSCAEFHPMWSGIVAICYADGSPSVMKFLSGRPDPIQRAVYGLNPVMIWSHIDSLMPKLYLESPREVKVLSFCPFDENILVGGCINGQIVIWDLTNKLENVEQMIVLSETREKYKIAMNAHMGWMKSVHDDAVVPATVLSNLQTCHYGAVTAIKWLSPNFVISSTGIIKKCEDKKQSQIFFTGSEDGSVLIWSLSTENTGVFQTKKVKKSKRILKRPSGLLVDCSPLKVLDRVLQPCYKIILGQAGEPHILPVQSFGVNQPPVKYYYSPKNSGSGRKYFTCEVVPQGEEEINTIIYSGSLHGEMRRFTWEGHAFNTGEVVNSEYCETKYNCLIHDGIITCTQKNPFLNDLTITVGGKIFALWSDKLMNRPLIWKKRPNRLTDARWSLYKPSMIFICTAEGDLETWDFLLRSDLPIAVQTLSGTMLTGVSLHTLPLVKNIIGVSDVNGSFKMFLDPPIFMIENPSYIGRMESMIIRELKVMQSFHAWQDEWIRENPEIILEMQRKEGALLAEKEQEKRRLREEEELRLEQEAEARRLAKMKVIGPEERWQRIVQKLIERTIAVKKRINRQELIEHEKPLRELEAQRLEKERRMLEIMKNQRTIFNDTVAILFPEAIKKPEKVKKSLLGSNKEVLKKEYIEEYECLKSNAFRTVRENPYKVSFHWEGTLTEGKERRQALNCYHEFIRAHKLRIQEEKRGARKPVTVVLAPKIVEEEEEEEVEE